MTSLFVGSEASDVVTVAAVRGLTGITSDDFNLSHHDEPDKALDDLLAQWIDETASNIFVRLGRQVRTTSGEAAGIRGVLVRTVANLVATAQQQRSSPVIQLGDFATSVMNASTAFDKLEAELAPFIAFDPEGDDGPATGGRVSVFWSSQEYEG